MPSPHSSRGSDTAFLYLDDTDPSLVYSDNQWFDNVAQTAFNHTLSSSFSVGASVLVQFDGE